MSDKRIAIWDCKQLQFMPVASKIEQHHTHFAFENIRKNISYFVFVFNSTNFKTILIKRLSQKKRMRHMCHVLTVPPDATLYPRPV